MKDFLNRIFIYLVLFFVSFFFLLTVLSDYVNKKGFKNSQTESNTLIIRENEAYNVLFLGISHARNFSRNGNHERVEKILNNKIINLGQGGGKCSINEQLFYLDYFYSKGNKTDKVCIVLSPPMLSSTTLPFASTTFENEAFDISFFTKYLFFDAENKSERLLNYTQSKFSKNWLSKKPIQSKRNDKFLNEIDSAKIDEGFKLAYGSGVNMKQFEKSCSQVLEIIKLAQKNNSKVYFFIPPALFGKWPGHYQSIKFLKENIMEYNFKYADFSEVILDPKMYYDHHHLNSNGVNFFSNNFLVPFFEN